MQAIFVVTVEELLEFPFFDWFGFAVFSF
jgi:hypothetical protein